MDPASFVFGLAVGAIGVPTLGLIVVRALTGAPWRLFWQEQLLEHRYEAARNRRSAEERIEALRRRLQSEAETVACPYCEGTGRRLGSERPCDDPAGCKGSGRLPPLQSVKGGGR